MTESQLPLGKLSFSDWLKNQIGRDDALGKYAAELKAADCWPDGVTTLSELNYHIKFCHGCRQAFGLLEVAWAEYRVYLAQFTT